MGRDQIVIVGGGIGGLTAALMLSRSGLRVRVLERADEFAEVGAGLQLGPNATRLLRGYGLLDEVLETSVRPRRLVAMNALTGMQLTAVELEQAEQRYGAPTSSCTDTTCSRRSSDTAARKGPWPWRPPRT
jgi:salicylate hydroxylase